MVELFFQLDSKWPKWCAQTLHPFSQILKMFPRIGAPIVTPSNNNFQIFRCTERTFHSRKNAANLI